MKKALERNDSKLAVKIGGQQLKHGGSPHKETGHEPSKIGEGSEGIDGENDEYDEDEYVDAEPNIYTI